jgi:hypothetical protein
LNRVGGTTGSHHSGQDTVGNYCSNQTEIVVIMGSTLQVTKILFAEWITGMSSNQEVKCNDKKGRGNW